MCIRQHISRFNAKNSKTLIHKEFFFTFVGLNKILSKKDLFLYINDY